MSETLSRRSFLAATVAGLGGAAWCAASDDAPEGDLGGAFVHAQARVDAWTDVTEALDTLLPHVPDWVPASVSAMGTWPEGAAEPTGFYLGFRDAAGRRVVITNAAGAALGMSIERERRRIEVTARNPFLRGGTNAVTPTVLAESALRALRTGRAQIIGA
jgi:hypothetical protein